MHHLVLAQAQVLEHLWDWDTMAAQVYVIASAAWLLTVSVRSLAALHAICSSVEMCLTWSSRPASARFMGLSSFQNKIAAFALAAARGPQV